MKQEKTLQDYKKAYEKNFNNQKACFDFGFALFKNKDYLDAYGIFIQAASLSGGYKNHALLFAGVCLRYYGKPEFAIDIFEKLLDTSEVKESLDELISIYRDNGDYENAAKYLIKFQAMTGDQLSLCRIASCYVKTNNFDKAKFYLDKVDKNSNEYSRALLEYGNIEILNGNFEDALKIYQRINVNKDEDLYYVTQANIGICLFKLDKYNEAKKHLLIGNEREKSAKYVLYYLGLISAFENKFADSVNYLSKLMEIAPSTEIVTRLSIAYVKCKNYKKAYDVLVNSGFSIKEMQRCKLFPNTYFFLKHKLGIPYNNQEIPDSYTAIQMMNYSKDAAIDHITYRHFCSDDASNFKNSVNISYLFDAIRDNLTEEYLFNGLTINDVYVLPVKGIGNNDEKYLRVVTIANSQDIITMYPIDDPAKSNYDEYQTYINDEDTEKGLSH